MEILLSATVLVAMYSLLFARRKRRMRAVQRTRKLAWDRNVEKLYGKWHTF